MSTTRWISAGALLAALAVALGAFGAHALKERLGGDQLAWWHTGVQYHGAHALALVLLGLSAANGRAKPLAGWLMVAGIALFSGSLYALALGAPRWLGAITPLGGIAFIAGWVAFARAAWSSRT